MEQFISNFNCSNALDIAVSIDILEFIEVHFLTLEHLVVAHLVSRLLCIELVLKHVDLVIECR